MARTGRLVCFISTVNGCSKKRRKIYLKPMLPPGDRNKQLIYTYCLHFALKCSSTYARNFLRTKLSDLFNGIISISFEYWIAILIFFIELLI